MKILIRILLILISATPGFAQIEDDFELPKDVLDSIYIAETESVKGKDKVLHAEPLYIDLIRDLGARKGEKEWNVAMGMMDRNNFNKYEGLIEYEWAPVDRLGLEVEVPFSIYTSAVQISDSIVPNNKVESLKLAAQYSLYVSEKNKTSIALGYINESTFRTYGEPGRFFNQIKYNPFLIAAKRWYDNYHTMLYTGPIIKQPLGKGNKWESSYAVNLSFHYMISGTRNFIGMETNTINNGRGIETVLRPQMRLSIADNLMVGIVTGIPVLNTSERLSTFFRVIYEPGTFHR
jgi:hypothetical protein